MESVRDLYVQEHTRAIFYEARFAPEILQKIGDLPP